MNRPIRLGVNIDHVATVRNARGGARPDPVRAALLAVEAGADGITAHLREDRRHINDADMARLKRELTVPLNFEMAATEQMLDIALRIAPHAACLVPEKRTERTTEGGLDVVGGHDHLAPFIDELATRAASASRCSSSRPTEALDAAMSLGAPVVELHTGAWCHAIEVGDATRAEHEFETARRRPPRTPRDRVSNATPAMGSTTILRAGSRPAGDRRVQHRPFPDRRGDLRRA